jgi:hypothetical protein
VNANEIDKKLQVQFDHI